MNIFKKFFGAKNQQPVNDSASLPDENLFVAHTPPAADFDEPEAQEANPSPTSRGQRRATLRPSVVREFLERNYFQLGYDHALVFASAERRDAGLVRICADYRQVLQQAAGTVATELESHQQDCLALRGVSMVLDQQNERRTAELQRLVDQIDQQLELSLDREGWLAPVVARYREGFTVGTLSMSRMQDTLGGLTTVL